MYTKKDAQHFLRNYHEIEKECNLYLVYGFAYGNKEEISSQKTGRENERNLIKKLDNKYYREAKYILQCVEFFLDNLSFEERRLIRAKYVTRMTFYDIANKYHYSITTVKRKDRELVDRFVDILNGDKL